MARPRIIVRRLLMATVVAAIAWACGGGSGARIQKPGETIGLGKAGAAGGRGATPGQPIQVPEAPVEVMPPSRGVISGRVTNAADGRPVFRARVMVSEQKRLPFSRVAMTDEDGRFRFTELPVGDNFVLEVKKTGFAPSAFGETPPAVPLKPIPLVLDGRMEEANVQLVPQVLVFGRVLDEDGAPFDGAIVEAMRAVFENGERTLVAAAQTISDDGGRFRLAELPPGQYYVSAYDPSFVGVGDADGALEYTRTYHPGVEKPDEATRLNLGPGTPAAPIEFRLKIVRPRPAAAVPPGGMIAGQVTNLIGGKPIARARVTLAAEGVLKQPRVTLTDAGGRYQFTGLPAGQTFVITVRSTGYAPRAFGEAPPAVPPKRVSLAANGREEKIDVRLLAQVAIAGRLLDEDDTPFCGALVEAMRAVYNKDQRTLVTVSIAITDDKGQFRLTGLPPGLYYLSAFDPAFANVGNAGGQLFYSPTFYPGGVFPDEASRITLDPGRPSEGLEFALKIIRPAVVKGSIVAGVKRAGSAETPPILSAAVIMSPMRNDQFSLFTLTEPTMSSNNDFEFANVPPGRYKIQARGETEREGVTLFSLFSFEVEGTDYPISPMVMSPGAIVSGEVEWDTHSGRTPSRSGVVVRAPMADGSSFGDAVTGTIGADEGWKINGVMTGDHYFRVDGLPEGWHLRRVDFQGADITDVPTRFDYGEVRPGYRIQLTDLFTRLVGFVLLDQTDVPESYAVVAFPSNAIHWRPHSRYIQLVRPDETGQFIFRGLPPGDYHVVATRDIDESDLGNPRVFDRLLPRSVLAQGLTEGRTVRKDVPVQARRRTGGR